jgi:NADPH:quinone reductase-like Zn-dependent oxidoreductase
MKYRSVFAMKRGGPEVLQVVENDIHPPDRDEVRIKVLAAPVSLPDVEARYGLSPFKINTPFVPGYAIIGQVDAVGDNVSSVGIGERIAVLTVYGGYSEIYYAKEDQLIPVPASLDPVAAAPLVLNYIVAYQTLHRYAKITPGDKVLFIGASGGIGTAFLDLGKLYGLEMYGLASREKHQVLQEYGATPIDYRTQDYVQVMKFAEPGGIDAVFDGIGGAYVKESFPLLRKGGTYVGYSNPLSISTMFKYIGKILSYQVFPNSRSARFYGTGLSRLNRKPFLEDWSILFHLLEVGEISPIIAEKFPLVHAADANRLLEGGQVVGNIVLEAA